MTRTIYRVSGRKRWVTIDQRAIEDARLPWAARGLLVYLLSKPDDWQVRVKDLQKRGDLGRDGIYKLLAVLRRLTPPAVRSMCHRPIGAPFGALGDTQRRPIGNQGSRMPAHIDTPPAGIAEQGPRGVTGSAPQALPSHRAP